jgi:hypothetical protein
MNIANNVIHLTLVLVLAYLALRYGPNLVAIIRQTGASYATGVKTLQGRG